LGSSKHFEFHGIFKKESRSTGCTSHQANQHGNLPEVKLEISEQMPNRVNNSSAWSAVIEKLGFNQWMAEDVL
jgi:hypothetical protein